MLSPKRLRSAISTLSISALLMGSVALSPVGAYPQFNEALPQGWAERTAEAAAPMTGSVRYTARQERAPWTMTACPQITDSISRLYTAYFLRAPDEGGFGYWMGNFSSGEWNLDRMSNFFAQSDEFVQQYGGLDNGQFVDLVYSNVFGRPADTGGREFWLGQIDRGETTRGRMLISFSESPEYVEQTGTSTPIAGFFNWIPAGSKWTCGFGNRDVQLQGGVSFVDVMLMNTAPQGTASVDLSLFQFGRWNYDSTVPVDAGSVTGVFGSRLSQSTAVRVAAPSMVAWAVVDSPTETSTVREGWFGRG